jgi:hypothetical protein
VLDYPHVFMVVCADNPFSELSRWAGDEEKVKKHEATIQKFKAAVRSIEERAGVINVAQTPIVVS